jgi:hypothetical protein
MEANLYDYQVNPMELFYCFLKIPCAKRQRKKREIVQNKNSLAVLRNSLTDLRKRSDYLSKWLDCFCYCLVLEKKNLFLVFFGSFEFVKGDGNCLIEFSIKYMFNYDG